MHKEYALQPDLLSDWAVFCYLYDKFGYDRGRVIARYPKNWTRMVYESLGYCMPMEKKRIEAGLFRLQSALCRRDHEWDKGKGWLDNAIEEHAKRPFYAILAKENPNRVDDVILEVDLYEEEELRWRAETQRRIRRTAEEITACAEFLLQNSKKILFVDPYFDPRAERFKRPLKALLQAVASRPSSIRIDRIEIHTGYDDDSSGTKAFFDAQCIQHLQSIIPRGLTVRFVRWDRSNLHNRFILTEYGGLQFATGLDDHHGSAGHHDTVYLLTPELYVPTWEEYQRDSTSFSLIEDDLLIEGAAT